MTQQVFVKIAEGTYQHQPITGTFPMVKPWKETPTSKHVTVATNERPRGIRVRCERNQFEYVDADGNVVEVAEEANTFTAPEPGEVIEIASPESSPFITQKTSEQLYKELETDEEVMDRMRRSFDILNLMTVGCAEGDVRGLVVTGPPGVGKSYGVEETLKEFNMDNVLAGREPDFDVIKGSVTPIALYQKLWQNKEVGRVVVLDDADIWTDEQSVNLLKAALDDKKKRRLSWLAESRVLSGNDIPEQFDFEGSVIFLTNLDPSNTRSVKMKKHLEALNSRCMYMDLDISSQRDRLLRIQQVLNDGLLKEYKFSDEEETMIFQFVKDNFTDMREQSLRSVKKLGDLYKMAPEQWKEIALHVVMKKEALYTSMLNEVHAESFDNPELQEFKDLEAEYELREVEEVS